MYVLCSSEATFRIYNKGEVLLETSVGGRFILWGRLESCRVKLQPGQAEPRSPHLQLPVRSTLHQPEMAAYLLPSDPAWELPPTRWPGRGGPARGSGPCLNRTASEDEQVQGRTEVGDWTNHGGLCLPVFSKSQAECKTVSVLKSSKSI